MSVMLWILSVVLIVIGVAGTVLPALPGAPLVLLGLIIAAWIDNFNQVGFLTITVLSILTIATLVIDFLSTTLGIQKMGASSYAVWGAGIGSIVGLFGGIIGIIFAPFIGALIGEYIAKQNLFRAGAIGVATMIALVIGIALKMSIIFSMLGIFLMAYIL